MHVARILVLAICWPTGSSGARDDSLHAQMELEIVQNSVMVRDRHGDTTKSKLNHHTGKREEEPKGSRHKSIGKNQNSTWNITSPFWQNDVSYFLGFGRAEDDNSTKCDEEHAMADQDKQNGGSATVGNWLSRLYWNFPIMIPPFVVILSLPFMCCFSGSGSKVHKDLGKFVFSYVGFFVANWAVLAIMTPGFFASRLSATLKADHAITFKRMSMKEEFKYSMDYESMLRILTVATGAVIFRAVAHMLGPQEAKLIATQRQHGNPSRRSQAAPPVQQDGPTTAQDVPKTGPTSVKDIMPGNIYMNLNRPLSQVLVKFTGQSFLMWMYCAFLSNMCETRLPYLKCSAARMQFTCIVLIALPVLQALIRADLGKEFFENQASWMALVRSREYKLGPTLMVTSRLEIYNRLMMDFLVNQVYRGVIVFTMHSVCLFETYLDLVLNVFALSFITKLDEETGDITAIHLLDDERDRPVQGSPLGAEEPVGEDGDGDHPSRAGVR